MPLTPTIRLGAYEIVTLLGTGGMGARTQSRPGGAARSGAPHFPSRPRSFTRRQQPAHRRAQIAAIEGLRQERARGSPAHRLTRAFLRAKLARHDQHRDRSRALILLECAAE